MTYQAVIERADDGTVFAYVPDFPGCTSAGATVEQAQRNVSEAARLWVEAAREGGDAVPRPTTIGSVAIEVSAA